MNITRRYIRRTFIGFIIFTFLFLMGMPKILQFVYLEFYGYPKVISLMENIEGEKDYSISTIQSELENQESFASTLSETATSFIFFVIFLYFLCDRVINFDYNKLEEKIFQDLIYDFNLHKDMFLLDEDEDELDEDDDDFP